MAPKSSTSSCRFHRIAKLRREIARERLRQSQIEEALCKDTRAFQVEASSSSRASSSLASVVELHVTTNQEAPALQRQREPTDIATTATVAWTTTYELNRGDWDSPVRVVLSRRRQTSNGDLELLSRRREEAARQIARWLRRRFARRPHVLHRKTSVVVRRNDGITPEALLARLKREIDEKATFQRQSRAAVVLQRFFTYVLDTRDGSNVHATQRILARQQARKRLAQEQLRLDKAVRVLQATYRGRAARRRFTWRQAIVKRHFMQVLVLEAEWMQNPSPAILDQLAIAYWTYAQDDQAYVLAKQRSALLRLQLVCTMKALSFGWTPPADQYFSWWIDHAQRAMLAWQDSSHQDVAMLEYALAALETARTAAVAIESRAVKEQKRFWHVYLAVLFALRLYSQVVRQVNQLDLTIEMPWRLQLAQAHVHLGAFDQAAAIVTAFIDANDGNDGYTHEELWLILGRCYRLAKRDDEALATYDLILQRVYKPEDIIRHELTPDHVANEGMLHLEIGAKCARRRDFPFAIELLRHGMRCTPSAVTKEHDMLLALSLEGDMKNAVESRASLEELKRVPVARLREETGAVL